MAGITEAQALEFQRELTALRARVAEVERREGLGSSHWLAGGASCPLFYFVDGTWVDEGDATNPQYATDQVLFHGLPGLEADFEGGTNGGDRRRIYLRFDAPVTIPEDRPATFVFFAGEILSTDTFSKAGGSANELALMVELVPTLSQATLEALTWNNQVPAAAPVPANDLCAGMMEVDTTTNDLRSVSGWNNSPNVVAAAPYNSLATEHAMAVSVRRDPGAAVTLAGVRLYFDTDRSVVGVDTEGDGWIMRTRVGDPHRSYLFIE